MRTRVSYVTIAVSNLAQAKQFYEGICGFRPTLYYEPTKWQAYDVGEGTGGFAISEANDSLTPSPRSLVDFFVDDVEGFWREIKSQVTVIDELSHAPWGTYKFVILDPDGNRLGFAQEPK
ncbi:VOC family protein [Candidatus Bathyarchaeota archaeon]|nr:VOC family protein [Candidatus Bathyarchaeota archaeon]